MKKRLLVAVAVTMAVSMPVTIAEAAPDEVEKPSSLSDLDSLSGPGFRTTAIEPFEMRGRGPDTVRVEIIAASGEERRAADAIDDLILIAGMRGIHAGPVIRLRFWAF